nr:hypothetical protein [Tanacetum cinerariifolium]
MLCVLQKVCDGTRFPIDWNDDDIGTTQVDSFKVSPFLFGKRCITSNFSSFLIGSYVSHSKVNLLSSAGHGCHVPLLFRLRAVLLSGVTLYRRNIKDYENTPLVQ